MFGKPSSYLEHPGLHADNMTENCVLFGRCIIGLLPCFVNTHIQP